MEDFRDSVYLRFALVSSLYVAIAMHLYACLFVVVSVKWSVLRLVVGGK